MRVQSLFKSGPAAILAMAFLSAGQVACTTNPKIESDYTGIGPLMAAQAAKPKRPSASSLARLVPGKTPAYKVGVQDQLIISVYGRDDLGSQIAEDARGSIRTTWVQEDGNINLPLIGTVQAAGRTISEIRKEVALRYENRVEIPSVDTQLHDCHSQSIQVSGAVAQPGVYYLCERVATLGDILSLAQGLKPDAYVAGGVLVRNNQTYTLDYPLSQDTGTYMDILMQPGDAIFFPMISEETQPVVYVFGEVGAQGVYNIPPQGMSLLEAIGKASGPDNKTAETTAVYLTRKSDEQSEPTTYRVSIGELFEHPDIQLADGDRIYIAPSGIAGWGRWWNQAIPNRGPL